MGIRPPVTRTTATSLVVLSALLLVACAEGGAGPDRTEREVIVFAAASLTDVVAQFAEEFTATTGADVRLNLAGSQTLVTQLVEGAPADVLITADTAQMRRAVEAGLVAGEPIALATNVLTIAVEAGNPLAVRGLADLARADLVLVLAAEEVPAGRYAREILERAGVDARPASREQSVRAALGKVVQGEADAAIVYASDVVAAGPRVTDVPIPSEENVVATYPAAVLRGAPAPEAAQAFVDLLLSVRGRGVLRAYGFVAP